MVLKKNRFLIPFLYLEQKNRYNIRDKRFHKILNNHVAHIVRDKNSYFIFRKEGVKKKKSMHH